MENIYRSHFLSDIVATNGEPLGFDIVSAKAARKGGFCFVYFLLYFIYMNKNRGFIKFLLVIVLAAVVISLSCIPGRDILWAAFFHRANKLR